MRSNKKIFFLCTLVLAFAINSCVKQKFDTPALAEFASSPTSNQGAYFVSSDPSTEFKVPIGITTTSNKDRVLNFTVTSSSAVAGQQYTVASNTITIPAGKVEDSIPVKGIYAGYPIGRLDTLTFTITGGDAPVFKGASVYTLIMQRYCDVVSTDLVGAFAGSQDYDANGAPSGHNPYTVTVSNWTSTGATSATIKIANLGATTDVGFGPFGVGDAASTGITATLDWKDPSNFLFVIPKQAYVNNLYGYGPATITGTGTFSSCYDAFTITYTVTVSAGDFNPTTTVISN